MIYGDEDNEENVELKLNTSSEQKLRRQMENQIKKDQKLSNKQNVQQFQNNFISHNYSHINSKVEKLMFKENDGYEKLKISTSEKMLINRRVLNDYIHIVNKRQDIVDQMEENFWTMVQLYDSTLHYFNKYYGSNLENNMENLKKIIKPEHRYLLRGISNNQVRIKRRILEYENAKNSSDPRLRKALEECKNIEEIVQRNQEAIRKRTMDRHNKIQEQSQAEKFSKKKGYMDEAMERESIRQNQIMMNEVQKFGSDRIKRQLFEEDMKALLQDKEIKDKIHKIEQSLGKMNMQQSSSQGASQKSRIKKYPIQNSIQNQTPRSLNEEDEENQSNKDNHDFLNHESNNPLIAIAHAQKQVLSKDEKLCLLSINEEKEKDSLASSSKTIVLARKGQQQEQLQNDNLNNSHFKVQSSQQLSTHLEPNMSPSSLPLSKYSILENFTPPTTSQLKLSRSSLADTFPLTNSSQDNPKCKSVVSFFLPSQIPPELQPFDNFKHYREANNLTYTQPLNKQENNVNNLSILSSKNNNQFPKSYQFNPGNFQEMRKASLKPFLHPNNQTNSEIQMELSFGQSKRSSLVPLKSALKKIVGSTDEIEQNSFSLKSQESLAGGSRQSYYNLELMPSKQYKINQEDHNGSTLTLGQSEIGTMNESSLTIAHSSPQLHSQSALKERNSIVSFNNSHLLSVPSKLQNHRLTALMTNEEQVQVSGFNNVRKRSKFMSADLSDVSILDSQNLQSEKKASHDFSHSNLPKSENNKSEQNIEEEKEEELKKSHSRKGSQDSIRSNLFKKKIDPNRKQQKPLIRNNIYNESDIFKYKKINEYVISEVYEKKILNLHKDEAPMISARDLKDIEEEKSKKTGRQSMSTKNQQIFWNDIEGKRTDFLGIEKEKAILVNPETQALQEKQIQKKLGYDIANLYQGIQQDCRNQIEETKNFSKNLKEGEKEFLDNNRQIKKKFDRDLGPKIYKSIYVEQILNQSRKELNIKIKKKKAKSISPQKMLQNLLKQDKKVHSWGKKILTRSEEQGLKKYSLISSSLAGIDELKKKQKEESLAEITSYIDKVKNSNHGQDTKKQIELLMTLDSRRKTMFEMTQKKYLPSNITRNKQKNKYLNRLLSQSNFDLQDLEDIHPELINQGGGIGNSEKEQQPALIEEEEQFKD